MQITTYRRKDFNLVEAAIVLGVIGLVIGGIWVAAASVQRENRRQEIQATSIRLYESYRSIWPLSLPFTPNCGPIVCLTDTIITPTVLGSTAPAAYQSSLEDPNSSYAYLSAAGIYYQVIGWPAAVMGTPPGDMISIKVGPLDYSDCVWLAGNVDTSTGWTGGRFYRWLKYVYTGHEWPSHQHQGSISGITPSSAETVCLPSGNFVNFNMVRP